MTPVVSRRTKKKSRKQELVCSPYFSPEARLRYFTSHSNALQVFDNESSSDEECFLEYGNDPPYNSHWAAVVHAVRAKPRLIQERVAHDPWKVLVATMLLNVTTGAQAIPVFWTLMGRWPNHISMANASMSDLVEILQPLGLHNTRAERLITFSKQYIESPPSSDRLWKSRVPGNYPPTAVSHFVGCGRYALDSFRIFCCPDDEWRLVMPLDKELRKYLKWKWAVQCYKKWEPVIGIVGPCDEAHLWSLAPFSQY